MVRIALNLDDVQVYAGGNFPIGKHRSKLIECVEQESSTGNPMLVWQWEGADQASDGEQIRSYTSLLEQALSDFKFHAEAFGYHGDTEVDTDACVGRFAILVVGLRKRRNRDSGEEEERPTVVNVLPDDQASTNGKSSGGIRRVGAGGGSKSAVSPSRRIGARPANAEVEDLPF